MPVEDGEGEQAKPVATDQAGLVGQRWEGRVPRERWTTPDEQVGLRRPEPVVETIELIEQGGACVRHPSGLPVVLTQLGEADLPLVEQLLPP